MIIQKFGGAAMRDHAMRQLCIQRIQEGLTEHTQVLVVVSAIGRQESPYSTDRLLSITPALHTSTAASDLAAACGELLASAVLSAELEAAGIENKIMHSQNAGITTTGSFGNATIDRIETSYMKQALKNVTCIIIPGFQGMNSTGDYMTLGRGGSDLTAIAIGSSLRASHVEFFKDVPGVMTADTHISPNAKKTAIPLYIKGIAGLESGTWIHPISVN